MYIALLLIMKKNYNNPSGTRVVYYQERMQYRH